MQWNYFHEWFSLDVWLIFMVITGRNGRIYWKVEGKSDQRHRFSYQRYDDQWSICYLHTWPTGWLFSVLIGIYSWETFALYVLFLIFNWTFLDVDNFLSDLALVLHLQTVQTTVIKSNLNPVWNEELMLSVTKQFGFLNLVRLNFILSLLENGNKFCVYSTFLPCAS